MTLREPSEARLAAQAHIQHEKNKHASAIPITSPPELEVMNTIPGDKEGIEFGPILGTAIKVETKQENTEHIHEKDERPAKTSTLNEPPEIVVEKTNYTHEHGHKCSRKNCTPSS